MSIVAIFPGRAMLDCHWFKSSIVSSMSTMQIGLYWKYWIRPSFYWRVNHQGMVLLMANCVNIWCSCTLARLILTLVDQVLCFTQVLFPSSTQVDLLELWKLSDPKDKGTVSLSNFLQQLKGRRPNSPVPGPSHYKPNVICVQRAVLYESQNKVSYYRTA